MLVVLVVSSQNNKPKGGGVSCFKYIVKHKGIKNQREWQIIVNNCKIKKEKMYLL
jgi:hypothetical protein